MAYIGWEDKKLIGTIDWLSREFTVLHASNTKCDKTYSLAVCTSVEFACLKRATNCLEAGGYLYWEVARHGTGHMADSGTKPAGSVLFANYRKLFSVLNSLGYTDIEAYWHRPDFRSCIEIIPLVERSHFRYVFGRNVTGVKGLLQYFLGVLFSRTCLFDYLVPNLSLIAKKMPDVPAQ